jgi:hypothetical protein
MKPIDKIDRSELIRSPGGDLYEVIGFITDPAVILQRVKDGHREVMIPTSKLASEWVEVPADQTQAELLDLVRRSHPADRIV